MNKLFDNKLINEAIVFATNAHGEQKRKGFIPIPYIIHPIDVVKLVLLHSGLEGGDLVKCAIVAALHDVAEDTKVTLAEIEEIFGKEIAYLVSSVTKNDSYKGSKREKMWENLGRIKEAGVIAGCVKLADRTSNLEIFPGFWTKEKIADYVEESMMIADVLGYCSEDLNIILRSRAKNCRDLLSFSKGK